MVVLLRFCRACLNASGFSLAIALGFDRMNLSELWEECKYIQSVHLRERVRACVRVFLRVFLRVITRVCTYVRN